MDKIFLVIALIAMAGVLFSLFSGLLAMAKGTKKAHQTSQKMMRFRVICQGVTVLFLFLSYLAHS